MKLLFKFAVSFIVLVHIVGCRAMDVPRVLIPTKNIEKKSDDQGLINLLVESARLGNYQGVKELIEFTNVNGVSNDIGAREDTALIAAVREGHFDICALLIANDADVNAINDAGNTALHYAAREGYEPISKLLLEHGAYVNLPNDDGDVALKLAAREGNALICRLLIEYGADLNYKNAFGNTALMNAAEYDREEAIQVLLTAIPLVDQEKILRTRASLLASQMALKKGEPALPKDVRLLIARRYMAKPIIDQLIEEQMARVELMLAMRNKNGFSALDYAQGNADMFAPRIRAAAVRLLDWSIPESREMVRKQIRNNIMHLLFDERLPYTPIEEERRARALRMHEEIQAIENVLEGVPEEELDELVQDLYPEGLPKRFERE